MTFSALCEAFSSIEKTSLRLEMTAYLAEIFKKLKKEEITPVCWLLLGRLAPLYENIEFNFAEKMIVRSLSSFLPDIAPKETEQLGLLASIPAKKTTSKVSTLFLTSGDLGNTTEDVLSRIKHITDNRTVVEVYQALKELAQESGEGSQDRKIKRMTELLKQSSPLTGKYLVRIVLSTLRLGFSDMTILDALSWTMTGDKSLRKELELAYQVKADLGKLATALLTDGIEAVKKFEIELGVPIAPALCQRLDTADEMIEKMGKVVVEPKYDGTRVLIHFNRKGKDWTVRTFTRNLEESSGMFPELIDALSSLKADQVILDSEAVGYDPETDKLLPFQLTIQRKRKHGIAETALKIPLRFFVFDLLYLDGKSLVHLPLEDRKQKLAELLKDSHRALMLSPMIVTDSAAELRTYHEAQLGEGLEGVVIKQIQSEYQPGRRGYSWVKFKEEEGASGKLSDTLDCVVMGYYKGQGKRTKFGIGAFLVGVYDQRSEQFKTIAKIGTGLSDAQWKEMRERCDAIAQGGASPTYVVPDVLVPDVWVQPSIVVEIAADEITNSPTHSAEIALRFPRLVKFRDDKKPEQTTTLTEMKKISHLQ
jgi:DNA ligase-1